MSGVRIEREPPIRFVSLDTGKRNVLTIGAIDALKEAIAPDADAPAVVLSGRSDGFCAGLDNATLAAGDVARESLLAAMGELLLYALEGPTRIVAVCEGHAVAAGAMLLLVSDVRLAVPGAYKVGFTEPRLGMPLPELPALLARERLDRRRLHELTALGRIVGPKEAAEAGFFDAMATPETLRRTAIEHAREISELGDAAYRGSLEAAWMQSLARIRELVAAQSKRRDSAIAAAR